LVREFPDIQDIDLEVIYDFIENGKPDNAPKGVAEYLVALDLVRGMYLRFDRFGSKDAIINHLRSVEGYSYYMANKLYNQAMEYFYCDSEISKASWRNIIAQKMEKAISIGLMMAENVGDIAKVNKMMAEMAKVLGLDQPDKEELPMEVFTRPFKMYSVDAEFLGLPPANRRELAQFVDELPDLSESVKVMLKREAMILPVKAFLDDAENPRKR